MEGLDVLAEKLVLDFDTQLVCLLLLGVIRMVKKHEKRWKRMRAMGGWHHNRRQKPHKSAIRAFEGCSDQKVG